VSAVQGVLQFKERERESQGFSGYESLVNAALTERLERVDYDIAVIGRCALNRCTRSHARIPFEFGEILTSNQRISLL